MVGERRRQTKFCILNKEGEKNSACACLRRKRRIFHPNCGRSRFREGKVLSENRRAMCFSKESVKNENLQMQSLRFCF